MNEIIKTILTVVFSSAGITFIQFLIQRQDEKSDKYKKLNDKIEKGLDERENVGRERYEEHKEAIEELRNIMKELAKTNIEQNKIINANSELLVGLTQDRLFHLTDKYCERGCITLDELAVLEEIYEPYHREPLNGNGRGKAGIEACRKLPKVSEEVAMVKDKELKQK